MLPLKLIASSNRQQFVILLFSWKKLLQYTEDFSSLLL